jgi:SAM-dependent methyltransferase
MSGEFPLVSGEPGVNAPVFDVQDYMSNRDRREDFVIIELGHNAVPIARNQQNLTGNRAYIGIEAWTRDRKHSHYLQHLGDSALKNTFFIDQYLYPEMKHVADRLSHDAEIFSEPYDPTTILPDNAADELFLSNVFGDPHVHTSPDRPQLLLQEARRLLAPNGTLVIRETLTPHFPNNAAKLADAGLYIAHRQDYSSNDILWKELEGVFNGSDSPVQVEPTSFYLFIQPTENPTDIAS